LNFLLSLFIVFCSITTHELKVNTIKAKISQHVQYKKNNFSFERNFL